MERGRGIDGWVVEMEAVRRRLVKRLVKAGIARDGQEAVRSFEENEPRKWEGTSRV